MKICPHCGEEIRDMDVLFHKCGPSNENGKPKANLKEVFLFLLIILALLSGYLWFLELDEFNNWFGTNCNYGHPWPRNNNSVVLPPIFVIPTILLSVIYIRKERQALSCLFLILLLVETIVIGVNLITWSYAAHYCGA